MTHKTNDKVAEGEAKLVFWAGTIGFTLCIVGLACAMAAAYLLPTYQALEPTKEDRCQRYLTFRHLEGYFEERTQHCVALTLTGNYILDDMYY